MIYKETNDRNVKESQNVDTKSKDKKEPSYEVLEGESSDESDKESRLNKFAKKSKLIITSTCTSPSNILRSKDKKLTKLKDSFNKRNLDKVKFHKLNHLIEDALPIFGVSLEISVERSKCHDGVLLPYPVRVCIDFIEEFGLCFEYVYKIHEVKSKLNQLKKSFNQRQVIPLNNYDVPIVTDLLKLFLRELPESVLTAQLLPVFEKIVAKKNSQSKCEKSDKYTKVLHVINQLPLCNRILLGWILKHLNNVLIHEKENKMGRQQLSTIFSVIFKTSSRLFLFLLSNTDILFPNLTIVKYYPPLSLDDFQKQIPENKNEIILELSKQESLLAEIHSELNFGFLFREELLWEAQTIITQLKRKLRMIEKKHQQKLDVDEHEIIRQDHEKSSTMVISSMPLSQTTTIINKDAVDNRIILNEEKSLNFNLSNIINENDVNATFFNKSVSSSLSASMSLSISLSSSLLSLSSESFESSLPSIKLSATSLISNTDNVSENMQIKNEHNVYTANVLKDHQQNNFLIEQRDKRHHLLKSIFCLKYQTLAMERLRENLRTQISLENESLNEIFEEIQQIDQINEDVDTYEQSELISSLNCNLSEFDSKQESINEFIDNESFVFTSDYETKETDFQFLSIDMQWCQLVDLYRDNILLKEKKKYLTAKIMDERIICIKLQSYLAFLDKNNYDSVC